MSNITPLLIEYNLQVGDHKLKASAEHLELARRITFFFDDKKVSEKAVPPGDFTTDDDCISELVEKYCKSQVGVYADLFKRHSDKVHLVSKTLDFSIDNYGIKMNAHVVVKKGQYHIEVQNLDGSDSFSGTFQSDTFSEVLEKVRIITGTLINISDSFSSHINELSNDKVEEWIKWD